jgi:hypothetical protein
MSSYASFQISNTLVYVLQPSIGFAYPPRQGVVPMFYKTGHHFCRCVLLMVDALFAFH